MRQIFTSLFIIVALLASTSVMAEKDSKTADPKTKTENTTKAETKECCSESKLCEAKDCCSSEKKVDAKCCSEKSEKKAGLESKSSGKK